LTLSSPRSRNWRNPSTDLMIPNTGSPSTLSRHIRRFRHLGLIERAARTYRYYLTRAGRAVIEPIGCLQRPTTKRSLFLFFGYANEPATLREFNPCLFRLKAFSPPFSP
jgi:DNA-binding MarR family transcriptional regulator